MVAITQSEEPSQQSEDSTVSEASTETGVAPPRQSAGRTLISRQPERSIPSSTVRTLLGLSLLALAVVAYTLTESGLEPERQQMLSLSLSGVALVVALFEATSILSTRDRLESPLELFAPAGVFLLALGGLGDGYVPSFSSSILISTGPVLAAGVLLLARAAVPSAVLTASTDHLLLPPGVEVGEAAKGEALSLSSGVIVAADSRIERGCCSVLERQLSPETRFRIKEEGDVLFAGSEVIGGSAEAVALSSSENSCLRSLEKLVFSNVEKAGASLHQEDLRSRKATAYVLVFVSVACAILWDERVGRPWDTLAASGLVLFAGIVCQLADILYSRQRSMVRRWARQGFIAASESAVRELASATKALFDPSRVDLGSLVRVRELEILDDRVGRQELTACLATLLGRAEEVALVAAGDFCQKECSTVVPERVLELHEIAGMGISGRVKGVSVLIGTEELLLDRGVLIHPSESNVESADNERPLLVAVGGELVARFWVVFGQRALVEEGADHAVWHGLVSAGISVGVPGEISPTTILVRGQESDVLGRSAEIQVSHFAGERFELPRSTVIALTRNLSDLPSLIAESHRYLRLVERARILVAFGAFLSVATVFFGFFSPLVASVSLGLVAAVFALL